MSNPSWDDRMTQLNTLLAELYSDGDAAQFVLARAGLRPGHINFNPAPLTNWFSILQEARKQNKVEAIVKVAREDYPNRAEWSSIGTRFETERKGWASITGAPALAAVVAAFAVLIVWLMAGGDTTSRITGHVLFQNSDSVVKGAIVRLPDGSRTSDPTDEAGFFKLIDVPSQTSTLFVLVSGKLHELTVVNQAGFRYRVVPPISETPPRLDPAEATMVKELAEDEPERFRLEGPQGHSKLWPVGATIRVGFLDGNQPMKDLVRQTAPHWTTHANIAFQWDADPKTADVRVSFWEESNYSYIGTDALGVSKAEPTIVLGGLVEGTADNAFAILHEFGHALGLVHEYQIPNAASLFDWDKIYAKAAQPPLHWTRQVVDANLRPTPNLPRQYATKTFDSESVMMNVLPDDWFAKPIKLEPRRALSAGDRAFIALLYPR